MKITAYYLSSYSELASYYESNKALDDAVTDEIIDLAEEVNKTSKDPVVLLLDEAVALNFALCGGAALDGAIHFSIEDAARKGKFAECGMETKEALESADYVMLFGLKDDVSKLASGDVPSPEYIERFYPHIKVVDKRIDRPRRTLR